MFQAILPMARGIISTRNAPLIKVLDNEQAKWIIAALGPAFNPFRGSSLKTSDLEKVYYGKVILVFDESPGRLRVKAAVQAFLYRFMRCLFAGGRVYCVSVESFDGLSEEQFKRQVLDPRTRKLLKFGPSGNVMASE